MSPAASRIKMSEYHIPFHIQEEIMKRLPVKSLVQFRSVSKAWKSLIDSSRFIAAHTLFSHIQPQHLLVWNDESLEELNYVCYSYIDNHTFPNESYRPTLPLSIKQLRYPNVVGSSCGLLCLHGFDTEFTTKIFVLWNPSIRKSIIIVDEPKRPYTGFGVCPVTNDPKIVSIKQTWGDPNDETSYRCIVMVYTLSSGKWRSLSTNLPTKRIQDWCSIAIVTDQIIYWRAESQTQRMIVSFDVTNESLQVIDLPDSLARHDPFVLRISKLRESLAILERSRSGYMKVSTVWLMEDGAQRSFTKLFTIKTPHDFILGFSKNGIPIMEVTSGVLEIYEDQLARLIVYEPNSEHNNVLDTVQSMNEFTLNSYVETLLLLGHADCVSYELKRLKPPTHQLSHVG